MMGQYITVHGDVISHVNITHVMVEDGGEYACIAENRAGRVQHAARLNIYGKLIFVASFYFISFCVFFLLILAFLEHLLQMSETKNITKKQ